MATLLIYLISAVLLLLLITIGALVYYSGIFYDVDAAVSIDIPFLKEGATFYYKTNKGSYGSLGGLFTESYMVAPGITQCAVYYDDPDVVSANDCRSAVGVLLNDENSQTANDLETNGFKKFQIPPIKEAVYTFFPHLSFLSMFIGAAKVIPVLRRCFKQNDCKAFIFLEVYSDDEKIHYIGILNDHDDYLVEEFAPEDVDDIVKISKEDVREAIKETGNASPESIQNTDDEDGIHEEVGDDLEETEDSQDESQNNQEEAETEVTKRVIDKEEEQSE